MSVTGVLAGYEFGGSHSPDWGGFCTSIEEAQQECQAIACGALTWTAVDGFSWEAVDPETRTVFEIGQRHYGPSDDEDEVAS